MFIRVKNLTFFSHLQWAYGYSSLLLGIFLWCMPQRRVVKELQILKTSKLRLQLDLLYHIFLSD